MNATLFVIVCAVGGVLLSLSAALALAWWVERSDPRRYERVG